ncbi:MAG: LicD family protein [Slackia faecicanis]|uniref:LicD family protein n=1 Tax=Slackia faecicanis TaxID=255723 RepID=UPI00137977AA|nr:LicD family protein [Slackia faecicanis]MDO5357933.1 LicD family protein [Slackia faecicanis]
MKKRLSSDEIKSIELNILLELDRICTEHGLAYLLAYGTCLGAVRHEGFIPWDDDIDVFMPRDDYEKLYSLFQNGLESPYELQTHRDGSSIYQFFKLVDPATESYETFVGKSRPIGLWVDIFPLERIDPSAKDAFEAVCRRHKRTGLKRSFALADSSVASTPAIKLVKKIVCPVARALFDVEKLNRSLENDAIGLPAATGADPATPHEKGYFCDMLGDANVFEASMFFPTRKAPFEGHMLPIPNRAEEYLSLNYGDWKALPPEDERHLHFPEAYAIDKE